MADSLDSYKRFIGTRETASDVVTAAVMVKFAATLGFDNAPTATGDVVPPGWHGGFFPATHRPKQMREDGQASGGSIIPAIPLPRRRIGGTRMSFKAQLRVGDEITRETEIADIQIDDSPAGAAATVIEKNTISNNRGVAVVEERDVIFLSEARAAAGSKAAPQLPTATWQQEFTPNAPLLFRFSAIRFNSHRIHYDREFVTKVEKLPGLVVQTSLVAQLMIEMCRRELAERQLTNFDFQTLRQIYDVGNFKIAGTPKAANRDATLWAADNQGNIAMIATATFG